MYEYEDGSVTVAESSASTGSRIQKILGYRMSFFLYVKSLKAPVKHFNILKDFIFKNVCSSFYPQSLLDKSGLNVMVLYHSDVHNEANYYRW